MINWIKNNWIILLVVLFAVYYVDSKNKILPITGGGVMMDTVGIAAPMTNKMMFRTEVAPSESVNRLVITDTSLSLQVADVGQKIKEIQNKAEEMGGFLINSNLSKPTGAASGTISLRIPSEKLSNALDEFKKMAVKVVSESVNGTDVTDQYTDLEAQLEVLNKTKIKFESILDKAISVEDIMNVQQQLIGLQQQIDNVKGQQKYYEQSAKLSKITIYLSTDDLALPYAPTNEWRPAVVLKEAVRSLVLTFRSIGNLLIWGIVYLPIIILIIGIILFWKKRQSSVK
ncbi:MAG: DUF4349 domain-containing protein [Candidatus Shapirobacteria bacterium]